MLVTVLIVLVCLFLLGGVPSYNRYGYPGVGGLLGMLLCILLVLWLVGALR